MSWHHIVVSTDDLGGKYYRIAEYYTDLNAWTENPVAPYEYSVDNLIWSLEKMLEAAKAAKESPELILDETAWEKQIKQAVDEADAGEFATSEKVEEIRLKWTKEDVAFMQEMVDNPPEPSEELVAAYKAYNASKNKDGSFNVEEK